MEELFKPKSLSIHALFTNIDSWYQVPPYQRHYRWEDEHVEKLWDSLKESWKNDPEGSYFLGSIITSKPKSKTRYLDIVDGQQRLTTLTILLCVIRDQYSDDINNENNNDGYAITINNIKDAIQSNDGKDRFLLQQKFTPGDSSATDFEENIIAEGATKKIEKTHDDLVRAEEWDVKGDDPKCRFINSALILSNRIKEIDKDRLPKFINYLFNNVQVIRIDCKDASFAITLFQVINTTGLNLLGSDLIKSFLFGKIDNLNIEDSGQLENKQKRFMHDWLTVEEKASTCVDTDADDILTLYLYYTCGQTAKRSLFEDLKKEFEEQLKNKEPNKIMGDIVKFVKIYKNRVYDAQDKVIFSLWYTPWGNLWKSILLTAMHTNYPNIDKLVIELRRFYYLHWIAGKTLSQVKQTSFDVINKIKKGESIENIAKMLRDKTIKDKKVEIIKDAIPNLLSPDIADQKWVKPLLLLLEYESKDNSTLAFIELDNKLHLEHVFPQKPKQGEWEHIEEDISEKYLNSAGNLTLLSGKKNIKASNNPFAEKMNAYEGRGLEGDDSGVTSFFITQQIVLDYKKGTYKKLWTDVAMCNRREWFLKKIAKLLDIEKEIEEEMKKELAAINSNS